MTDNYDFDFFVIGAARAACAPAGRGQPWRTRRRRRRALPRWHLRQCRLHPEEAPVYAAEFSEAFEDSAGFGWTLGERRFDWNTLIAANKNAEITRLRNGIYENILINSGVKIAQKPRANH